ncbi:MAG: decaprenyl-phosphate phosphoribosyltransferase [Acidobacteriota bacterium]
MRNRTVGSWLGPLLRALRPLQWVKNGLVFAAPLFAYKITAEAFLPSMAAFAVFCAVSSGTYLVNDLFDLQQDRLHPVKQHRPLASGALSRGRAMAAAFLLLSGGLVSSLRVGFWLFTVVGAYLTVQALYNLAFKHVLILDIMALASGFLLRAVAGGVAARVPLSPWFLFCVAILALYVGLQKRKSELTRMNDSGVTTRPILRQYSIAYLRQIETALLACILMGYSLWTIQGAKTNWMMISVPFVLYGILRYQYLSQGEILERPEEVLFKDKPLLLNLVLWVLTCFVILGINHLSRH